MFNHEIPCIDDTDLLFSLYQFFDRYDIPSEFIIDKIMEVTNEDNMIEHFQKWFDYTNSDEKLLHRLALRLAKYLKHNSEIIALSKGLEQILPLNSINFNPSFVKYMESIINTHDSLSTYPVVSPKTDPQKLFIQQTIDDIYLELTSACPDSFRFGLELLENDEKARLLNTLFEEYKTTDDLDRKEELIRELIELVFEEDINQGVMTTSDIIDHLKERIESDHRPIYFREPKCYSPEQFIMMMHIKLPEKLKKLYINIKDFDKIWTFHLPAQILKTIFKPSKLEMGESSEYIPPKNYGPTDLRRGEIIHPYCML
jgi:hypothetical protein